MENVLSLSLEEQNHFNSQLILQSINDNKQHAEENGENVADYFLRDFDASPEGWNFAFEFSYDEISSQAKEERKKIITNMLVSLGFISSEN